MKFGCKVHTLHTLVLSMAIWHLKEVHTYVLTIFQNCIFHVGEMPYSFYAFCRSHYYDSFVSLHFCRFSLYLLQAHCRQGLLLSHSPVLFKSMKLMMNSVLIIVLVSQFWMFTMSKCWNSMQGWRCLCFPSVKPSVYFCTVFLMAWAVIPR